jgi:hypothetical protein
MMLDDEYYKSNINTIKAIIIITKRACIIPLSILPTSSQVMNQKQALLKSQLI